MEKTKRKVTSVRKTRFQQLHLIITIIAALITTAICAVTRVGLYNMAVIVSAVIVIFYALGQVVRLYLQHVLKTDEPAAEEILEGQVITDDTDADDDGSYARTYAEMDSLER